ncbi:MAG TPA: hypothetical protein DCZ92_01520 [Elusimicrobia bacterium]|nr:MAG: hypothetical protein A2016_12395 [Elusimicrobia bacterium GWF2_62_30]HBA59505.1 hypothetical protein [Elusimicrobiota bacterium]
MKAKISIIAGFIIGAGLLFMAFRKVDFASLMQAYSSVNAWYIIPAVITAVVELLLRGARWRLLLNPSAPVRLWDAFRLQAVGLGLNNILPMRLGEVARGTFGAKLLGIPMITVFATILVERAVDLIVMFFLFAVAVRLGGIGGGLMNYGGWLWGMCAGLGGAMAVLVFADELVSHRWLSGLFVRFPLFRNVLEKLAMGVKGFHSFRSGVLIVLFAALQWGMSALNYFWLGLAFGIGGVMDAFKCMVLAFTGALAASVPGMPGYFGAIEFAIQKVAFTWGIPENTGLAYASYVHVIAFAVTTVLGVFFVYQMGYSLGKVWGGLSSGGGEKK